MGETLNGESFLPYYILRGDTFFVSTDFAEVCRACLLMHDIKLVP